MKVIIVTWTMEYLSGSSTCAFNNAREMVKQGHDVSLLSRWGDYYKNRCLEAGIKPITTAEGEYDLALISHRDFPMPIAKTVINRIGSEYECETPIVGLDHYIAIRESIKEHLIKEHRIPAEKIEVIYSGVDLEEFKPIKKTKRNYTKVVIPATRDHLRQKMFDYYTDRANKDFRIFIYGKDHGAKIKTGKYIEVHDQVENIKDYIGDSDLVPGILFGTINLEARAMGIPSRIHNPANPEEFEDFFPDRLEFEKHHDIKNVVKRIFDKCQKI